MKVDGCAVGISQRDDNVTTNILVFFLFMKDTYYSISSRLVHLIQNKVFASIFYVFLDRSLALSFDYATNRTFWNQHKWKNRLFSYAA